MKKKNTPFLLTGLPPSRSLEAEIEERLCKFARKLALKYGKTGGIDLDDEFDFDDISNPFLVSISDKRDVIVRRSKAIAKRAAKNTGGKSLSADKIKMLEPIARGANLVHIDSVDTADEIASKLHVEFPWLAPATVAVWHALRRSAGGGKAWSKSAKGRPHQSLLPAKRTRSVRSCAHW